MPIRPEGWPVNRRQGFDANIASNPFGIGVLDGRTSWPRSWGAPSRTRSLDPRSWPSRVPRPIVVTQFIENGADFAASPANPNTRTVVFAKPPIATCLAICYTDSIGTPASIVQAGYTWTQIATQSPGAGKLLEMWLGVRTGTASSAGPDITATGSWRSQLVFELDGLLGARIANLQSTATLQNWTPGPIDFTGPDEFFFGVRATQAGGANTSGATPSEQFFFQPSGCFAVVWSYPQMVASPSPTYVISRSAPSSIIHAIWR